MFEEKDETILARWLANKLTPLEQQEFEASPEYQDYKRITDGMNTFIQPSFDKAKFKEKLFNTLKTEKKAKVISLKPLIYITSVAASILLIIGIFFNEVTYTTPYGKQLAIVLPDNSEVTLNAKSTLTHKRFFWNTNKAVVLDGEGLFSIEKGNGFKVKTNKGTIKVLGTQFNVKARTSAFTVTCYEGKVQFNTKKKAAGITLTQGDEIALIDKKIEKRKITTDSPSWLNGSSVFNKTPIDEVFAELERQYGINIKRNSTINNDYFTGSFTHNDLNVALKTVFGALGLEYSISNNQKTVTIKNR